MLRRPCKNVLDSVYTEDLFSGLKVEAGDWEKRTHRTEGSPFSFPTPYGCREAPEAHGSTDSTGPPRQGPTGQEGLSWRAGPCPRRPRGLTPRVLQWCAQGLRKLAFEV